VMDRLVLVSDYTVMGIRSSRRIYELAKAMGIKLGRAYLVINKVTGRLDALKKEIKDANVP